MGTKHPFEDAVHPSRKSYINGSSNKRQRSSPYDNGAHPSFRSTNALKSKVRDLTRLLDHSKDLPANVRVEKERALVGYRADLEYAQDEKRRSDMIKRYHMVRFFERQKATRALKRLQKQLDATGMEATEHEKLLSAIHEGEVDLNYTMYYPLGEKYQSLYPRTGDQKAQDEEDRTEIGGRGERKLRGERPPLWFLVERAMTEGSLEALRDGKGDRVVVTNSKPQAPINHKGAVATGAEKMNEMNRGGGVKLEGGAVPDNEDDEISDGGFFEE